MEVPLGTEHFSVQPNTSVANGLIEDATADWPLASRPSSSCGLRQYLGHPILHVLRWTVMTLHTSELTNQIVIGRPSTHRKS